MEEKEFSHQPVLCRQCIAHLAIKPDGVYVDGTAGGAGHSCEIAKRLQGGRLIALDKDPDAVAVARQRLLPYAGAQVVQSDFSHMAEVLDSLDIRQVDGILLDLGVSSYQIDTPERGFSYIKDAPLDMRMSQTGFSAYDLVNNYDFQSLCRVLHEYGEEKFAPAIAKNILRSREKQPVRTTGELAQIVRDSIPARARREGGNPAKRTFQAIRIEVNGELDSLSDFLHSAFSRLAPGGRMAIITFHSLEDRMVKQRFAAFCKGCVCPPDFPVCICGKKPLGRLVRKKPIEADETEQMENSRSRSAKLRVIEKL